MASVCFYFQVHQPLRIKKYRVYDIGKNSDYFNDDSGSNLNNQKILKKVAQKSYLPTNKLFLELLKKFPKFKISFSFSGLILEQLEKFSPETLSSFKELVKTGKVEVLSETYYHSLSFLYSRQEFRSQIDLHRKKIQKVFKVTPQVFRNTELVYNNDLANEVEKMGYKGILAEGADYILGWRSPNFVYLPKGCKKLSLLLKNYKLSDDVAFRFSSKSWSEYPLTAPKFANWISAINGNGNVVNLFMDYETFGEHQWEDTGIFEFLRALPLEILKHPDNDFVTPSEAVERFRPVAELDVPNFVSWADVERDLSAWLSNPMQKDAFDKLYDLEKVVLATKNKKLTEDWRRLQTSDHFYYMCTKWFADGDVHKYFNPYDSPYDAFISFINVLNDLKLRLEKITKPGEVNKIYV
ncbi:alpha-amylase [Candidatus Woesebacteria bacterium RIFCSPHIGHO2_02_FULL_38_9]|uniref:Alpha-amylase n=1 Tax=Candidatus Woesebacteria bacterium RIFCSPHIGHO2_01_FULL_39_28 TaxID=1802496 RepID=A0A1F7YEB2_9BACT|nr:MAG: alpha-amylase [Candidatus Woesebacteria bacterium RIFCSPHIGHO2_01_FULL_39_28]OGM35173.1 MAG: alpha-amylase [Candidatus Woesebacteria bacterium RIFCSPHIGHO2_02_FULL_38_9]OGM57763.1 MAG: alpha-amylase [Candidatus Woesebacteria bacterium RIFCSPLOWO2_01_FULL_38_20]